MMVKTFAKRLGPLIIIASWARRGLIWHYNVLDPTNKAQKCARFDQLVSLTRMYDRAGRTYLYSLHAGRLMVSLSWISKGKT